MPKIRVSLGFNEAPDPSILELAEAVFLNLFGKPAFPTPPIMQGTLAGLRDDFVAALGAMEQGGTAATAFKDVKREALIGGLRQLAAYVQSVCNNDLGTLLSSGFDAVSTNRAQSPLATPEILGLTNGGAGVLIVKVKPVANAKCYEVRCAPLGAGGTLGPWQTGGLFTASRAMRVSGLTRGTDYSVEVRAIGGSTGYSEWTNPVSHMCI